MSLVHRIQCGEHPEILDFIPLTTVDYSGGMIISDWYSEGAQANSH